MATMVQPPSVPLLPCLLAAQPPLHSLVKPHFSHHVIFPHAPPVIERGLSAALSTQPTLCAITLHPVTRQGLPWAHWSCPAIGWRGSGPFPQSTNWQQATLSSPVQSLVGASGPRPQAINCRWAAVSEAIQPAVGGVVVVRYRVS